MTELRVICGTVTQKIRRGSTIIVTRDGVKVRARWWWRLLHAGGRIRTSKR